MEINTQSYKGTRDFYPEDKRLQKWMFAKIRSAVERFGYEEYDAPVIENTELYNLKGSAEIVNEQSYSFTDRGGRNVTLRTEMTPSVSRMVAARRQHLTMPLRWYSIPNLWRYERPQKGRLREFWQLNVDIFGIDTVDADVEIIQIADAVLKEFGAKKEMYQIHISSRAFLDALLDEYLKLDKVQSDTMRRLIDKRTKMSEDEFTANIESILSPTQRDNGIFEKLISVISCKNLEDLPDDLKIVTKNSKIFDVISRATNLGITNIEFDPTLVRGFDYYNGLVFEIFDTNPNNNRAMYGGGRYDGLVELFGVEKVPTVGFGMGDVTLENFLKDNKLIPKIPTETELYVVLAGGTTYEMISKQLELLREEGVNVAVDITNKKIGKQIENASKKNVAYALIIGDQEISNNQYVLKNLKTGTESTHSLERIISIIKSKDL